MVEIITEIIETAVMIGEEIIDRIEKQVSEETAGKYFFKNNIYRDRYRSRSVDRRDNRYK